MKEFYGTPQMNPYALLNQFPQFQRNPFMINQQNNFFGGNFSLGAPNYSSGFPSFPFPFNLNEQGSRGLTGFIPQNAKPKNKPPEII